MLVEAAASPKSGNFLNERFMHELVFELEMIRSGANLSRNCIYCCKTVSKNKIL